MAVNSKLIEGKLDAVQAAWETLRPTKSFGSMTLAQFKAAVKPSRDARQKIADLQTQLQAAIDERGMADEATQRAISLAVNGVRADPAEGADGELYGAMGYVRTSEKKTGLTRKRRAAAPKDVSP